MTNTELRAWINNRHLTRRAAAEMLGLSIDGLDRQLSGSRKVSNQTEQLCQLWDAYHGEEPAMNGKQWCVLRWADGNYSVVSDYGDYAWGAANYKLLGYWPTHHEAQEAAKKDRERAKDILAAHAKPTEEPR